MSWCSLAEWCPWPMIKQKHMARCDCSANLLSFFSRSTANDSSGSLVCDESETDQLISIAVLAQVCVWRHRSRDIDKCAPRRLQGTFVWWTVDFDINQLAAATSCLLNLEHLVATSSADWLTECRDVSTRRNVSVSRHRAEQLRQQQCAVGVIGLVGSRELMIRWQISSVRRSQIGELRRLNSQSYSAATAWLRCISCGEICVFK